MFTVLESIHGGHYDAHREHFHGKVCQQNLEHAHITLES